MLERSGPRTGPRRLQGTVKGDDVADPGQAAAPTHSAERKPGQSLYGAEASWPPARLASTATYATSSEPSRPRHKWLNRELIPRLHHPTQSLGAPDAQHLIGKLT